VKKLLTVLLFLFLVACGGGSATAVTPDEVVAAFKSAGLEAESPRPLTREDYGAAPYVGSGVRFLIPSLCEDCGGRVFTSTDSKDLDAIKSYYDELGRSSALFFSWTFANGNILVQINGSLDESTARQYETALNSVGK
jgi:hypothetical protein